MIQQAVCAWPRPTAIGRVLVGRGGILSTPAASHLIRKNKRFGGLILSASHNPGGPDGDFGIKYNIANGGPAPEKRDRCDLRADRTIDRWLKVESPTTSTSTAIGSGRNRRHDGRDCRSGRRLCRADGELVRLRRDPARCSQRGFSHGFDAMSAVTGPYAKEILERRLGAPARHSLAMRSRCEDFGGHHPDPNLVACKGSLCDG